MDNVYAVKNLVIAMPGTGKSHYTRKVNQQLPRNLRPVIDFDYSGPRLTGDDALLSMLDAQTRLINTFAELPYVHTIFVHPDAVSWRNISRKDFNITFALPGDVKALRNIVQRQQMRDGNCQFTRDYSQLAEKWWRDNIYLAGRLVTMGFRVCILELTGKAYFDETYNPDEFHPGGRLLNYAHDFVTPHTSVTEVRDYNLSRDANHRRLVSFLMSQLASILEYRGELHDMDKGDRHFDCSSHHTLARHHYNHKDHFEYNLNLIDLLENLCDVVATSAERGQWNPPRQSAEFYESLVCRTMNQLRGLITDGEYCQWVSQNYKINNIDEQ